MTNDKRPLVVATIEMDPKTGPHVLLHWQSVWQSMDIESRGRSLLQLLNAIEDTAIDCITDIQAARRKLRNELDGKTK